MNVASLLVLSEEALRAIEEASLDLSLRFLDFLPGIDFFDKLVHDWLIVHGPSKCIASTCPIGKYAFKAILVRLFRLCSTFPRG